MLIAGFPAGSFQANCYLLAPARGRGAVVVDPGEESADRVAELVREHELTIEAVLLTHGHFDHVADAAAVSRQWSVPAWLHHADEHMLDDPFSAMGPQLAAVFADSPLATADLRPAEVRELVAGESVELAGLRLHVEHTPGHTLGSVSLRLDGDGERPELLFTGDTLFAGSVGRSDLPGGDHDQLLESITSRLLSRADDSVVLPGHGSTTTIGAERTGNPFLTKN